jgi:hypothetical protein
MIDQLTDGIVWTAAVACVGTVIKVGTQWLSETKLIGGIYEHVEAKRAKQAKQAKAEKE